MPIIVTESLEKKFEVGGVTISPLRNINLKVSEGEFSAVVAPSGSGKTTLFNIIGCIEKPTSGRLWINGIDTTSMPLDDLAGLRASHLGFIFQTFNLIPVLTALENVEYPLLKKQELPKSKRREKATELLKAVGLDRFAHHRPGQMSGGQRQRVAIARALVGSPSIIIADEPTANLDFETGEEIINIMKELNKKLRTTFLFSTNDTRIMLLADKVLGIVNGELVEKQK